MTDPASIWREAMAQWQQPRALPCRDCGGERRVWVADGNDPSGRYEPCETCGGSGEATEQETDA